MSRKQRRYHNVVFVQAIPDPPASVVTAELIGSIVGVVLALLLAILLLAFAVYTKR
jgi:hypothetical protein